MLESDEPTVSIRLSARDNETKKVDERVAHKLLVHTNDPDEPKLEIEYGLRSVRALAPALLHAPETSL